MTALLGKLLLFCGCTALGVGRGLALRRRTACLRAAARALEALARELSFSLRPLTELMAEADILGTMPSGPMQRSTKLS